MLAAKLHKTPKPRLMKGSYLVPVIHWKGERASAEVSIRQWRKILEEPVAGQRRHRPNRTIRYLSLVRIPDHHSVAVFFDFSERQLMMQGVWPIQFRPLREWKCKSDLNDHEWCTSEVMLGERLPDSAVLWTKDILKLYGRPARRNKKVPRKADS